MSSDEAAAAAVTAAEQDTLLDVARQSIAHTLNHGEQIRLEIQDYPDRLRQQRAAFVTLHLDHELRGCIGNLEAYQPVVLDVARNAYAAAFSDPRFLPVTMAEFERIDIHIAILNPAEEMQFDSQTDLITQLRPGIDGLIIQQDGHRGTFLPSVWEQLPEPEQFFAHLKLKAGLSPKHWSPSLRVWRYITTSFP
ncbi:hypothetical protein Tel_05840 [Candidatus Tenderia electrophaga]|jgi:hypothetical protein|uniref:AMMECR1 domain-containing protein n=1 Tax=Candidatus Tenderia electrophaga TaxID=1748243 RepID=A0A0S2TC04_9GAMM|nr:hypothetical protein Tel_05840 [Candidatus Tenderia electrophaga]